MQQQIGERPGSQVDWISLSQLWNKSAVGKYQDNTYQLIYYHRDQLSEAIPLAFAQQGGTAGKRLRNSQESGLQPSAARTQELETSFLYLGSLQEKVAVTGALTFLENPCVKLSLRLSMLNKEGQIVSSLEKDYYPKDSPRFKLSMRAQNPAYLLLDVLSYDKNDLINSCTLEINSVAVATQK
jgi:hypothetical protein